MNGFSLTLQDQSHGEECLSTDIFSLQSFINVCCRMEYHCWTCMWICGLCALKTSPSDCHSEEKGKRVRKKRLNKVRGKGEEGKSWRRGWRQAVKKDQRTRVKGFMSSAINCSYTSPVLCSESIQGRGGTAPQTQGKLPLPSPGPFPTHSTHRRIPALQQEYRWSPNAPEQNSPHHCVLCTDYPPDFPERATSPAAWKHSPDGSSLHCRFS